MIGRLVEPVLIYQCKLANKGEYPYIGLLYSFRRCPYAMRARMALKYCGIRVDLREIELKSNE
jgi:hypothetical protein